MSACFALAALAVPRPAAAADPDEGYGEAPYMEAPYDDGDEGGSADGYDGTYGYDDERAPPPGDRFGAGPPDRFRGPDSGRGDEAGRWDDGPASRSGSIKDGYPVPMPSPRASAPPPRHTLPHHVGRPPAWVHVERPPVRGGRHVCLDRWQIRRQLRWEGWTAVRPLGGEGGIVRMRARRFDSSSVFDLRVDRCSGEVLAAWPRARHFADRDWRRDRRGW
jgi:hypothetical protein